MDLKDIRKKRNGMLFENLTDNNHKVVRTVGLYVDLPNLYATMKDKGSFPRLEELIAVSRSLGDLLIAKIYTTIRSSSKNSSILGLERMGYTVVPRFVPDADYGLRKDIDTFLAVDAVNDSLTMSLDILIVASNDSDFAPLMRVARKAGVTTVAIVSSHEEAKLLAESATVYLEGIWSDSENEVNQTRDVRFPVLEVVE
jgi:uncharacterized protein (TIGR00288 family)